MKSDEKKVINFEPARDEYDALVLDFFNKELRASSEVPDSQETSPDNLDPLISDLLEKSATPSSESEGTQEAEPENLDALLSDFLGYSASAESEVTPLAEPENLDALLADFLKDTVSARSEATAPIEPENLDALLSDTLSSADFPKSEVTPQIEPELGALPSDSLRDTVSPTSEVTPRAKPEHLNGLLSDSLRNTGSPKPEVTRQTKPENLGFPRGEVGVPASSKALALELDSELAQTLKEIELVDKANASPVLEATNQNAASDPQTKSTSQSNAKQADAALILPPILPVTEGPEEVQNPIHVVADSELPWLAGYPLVEIAAQKPDTVSDSGGSAKRQSLTYSSVPDSRKLFQTSSDSQKSFPISRRLIIGGVVVILLAALGVGAYHFVGSKRKLSLKDNDVLVPVTRELPASESVAAPPKVPVTEPGQRSRKLLQPERSGSPPAAASRRDRAPATAPKSSPTRTSNDRETSVREESVATTTKPQNVPSSTLEVTAPPTPINNTPSTGETTGNNPTFKPPSPLTVTTLPPSSGSGIAAPAGGKSGASNPPSSPVASPPTSTGPGNPSRSDTPLTPTLNSASKTLSPPVPIAKVLPVYPDLARRMNVTGKVDLSVIVDEQGRVVQATVLGGPSILHAAAVDAIKKWRFKPAALNGTNVRAEGKVSIVFNEKN